MIKFNTTIVKLILLIFVSIKPNLASEIDKWYSEDEVFDTIHGKFLLSYCKALNAPPSDPFDGIIVEMLDKQACDNYVNVLFYSLADSEYDPEFKFVRNNLSRIYLIFPKEVTVDTLEKFVVSDSINHESLPALSEVIIERACGNRFNEIKTVAF